MCGDHSAIQRNTKPEEATRSGESVMRPLQLRCTISPRVEVENTVENTVESGEQDEEWRANAAECSVAASQLKRDRPSRGSGCAVRSPARAAPLAPAKIKQKGRYRPPRFSPESRGPQSARRADPVGDPVGDPCWRSTVDARWRRTVCSINFRGALVGRRSG